MGPDEIERVKLTANAFDRVSTACFTVGIATPFALDERSFRKRKKEAGE